MRRPRLVNAKGLEVTVPIRESKRAKRMRLYVGHTRSGEVELVVPPRASEASIDRFLDKQRTWIADTIASQRAQATLGLGRPGVVWRLGEPLPLVRLKGTRPAVKPGLKDGQRVLGVAGPLEAAPALIDQWLREETRLIVDVLCRREAPLLGVDYGRLRIGDQRSLWGSCAANGNLSFSWRLALCPLWVVDYVVVHELCHRRHFDHSKDFWALVASRRPDYRRAKEWLDRHGVEVRSWRPEDALGL